MFEPTYSGKQYPPPRSTHIVRRFTKFHSAFAFTVRSPWIPASRRLRSDQTHARTLVHYRLIIGSNWWPPRTLEARRPRHIIRRYSTAIAPRLSSFKPGTSCLTGMNVICGANWAWGDVFDERRTAAWGPPDSATMRWWRHVWNGWWGWNQIGQIIETTGTFEEQRIVTKQVFDSHFISPSKH